MPSPFVPVPGADGTELLMPPELAANVPGFGQPVEQVPPEVAPPPFMVPPAEAVAPEAPPPVQHPFAQMAAEATQQAAALPPGTSVRVSEQGYAPPTRRDRDPVAPVMRAEQEVRQATERQAQNVEAQGQLQAEFDESVGKFALEQKQRMLDENEADRVRINDELAAERDAQQLRIRQAIDAIPQRDPKAWWTNMDDFQQGAAFVAAGIDGYLNPGGANGSIELANQLAERDAFAQMTNIETAQKKVGYEKSLYEQLIGDQEFKRQSFLEQKAYRLESLAVGIEQRGMTFKSQFTQLKHKAEADKIRAEASKTLADLAQSQTVALGQAADRALRERMQKREMAFEVEKARAAAGAKAAEEAAPIGNPAVPGDRFFVDPAIAKGLERGELKNIRDPEKGLSGYATFATDMRELIQLQEEIGAKYGGPGGSTKKYIGSEEYQKARQLYQRIASPERHKLYGAALTAVEAKNFKEYLPEPTTWTSLESRDNYRAALTAKNAEAQRNFGNVYGLQRRNTDGSATLVNLEEEWAALPPATQGDAAFNPTQSVFEARRGLASGAVPPGDATIKKVQGDIDEAAKMASRGQAISPDVPNEAALPEMIDQASQLADELEATGRTVEALQVRNKVGKLVQAAQKAQKDAFEAGFGPTIGQETPLPPKVRRGQQTVLGQ
jgi:hypothetical protein